VHVNDQALNNDAYAPFGGAGASGNGSRFGSQSSAAHPNLGPVTLSMAGGGTTWGFTLPPATPGQIAGAATNGFAVSDLPSCAYIVTLETQVLLTTGDGSPDPVYDQIAFCKR
jgi:hypothetical protein